MNRAGAAVDSDPMAASIDRIARSIADGLELPELSRRVARAVRVALGAETAAVYLVEGATLRCIGASGDGAAGLEGTRSPLSAGVSGAAARTGLSVLVGADAGAKRALIAAPLVVKGHAIGTIEVAIDLDREPGPDDRQLLERLAPHVAAAVTNATLADELHHARAALARSGEELERRVRAHVGSVGEAKREWEQAFDAITDPLAIYEDGVVRRANLAFAAAGGRDIRHVAGIPCHQALFGREAPCPGCPIHAGVAADGIEAEVHAGSGDFLLRASRLDAGDRPNAWVVSYRDISEERSARAKLAQADRLAAVGLLAAGAAHEINNPMAFLSSALRTLREHVADLSSHTGEVDLAEVAEDARAILDEADEGARRITAIVQGLRVLGQEEFGQEEPFEVAVVLARAVERAMQPDGPVFEWLHREPVHVFGSPVQFERAFLELLRNGAQAAGRGGTVRLSCREKRGEAVVTVADEGPGIPPESLPRIFEPFYTTRGIGQGLGLGLAIAYGVVRRYDGAIEVESRPSQGTLVRVVLAATPPAVRGLERGAAGNSTNRGR